ncbi:MAG TPA: SURF1 family protein [Stellaceae bacterium]|nr:SURF1 family protein [Stellaceae bacterium]
MGGTTQNRSLLWPTLWSALGLLLLLGLGTWQVQRLQWKEGLIAERNATLTAAPVPLPQTLDQARALEFHPVHAEGEFLNDHELYLNAQSFSGDQGFLVVTPFRLSDGRIVFIDRGFVPTNRKDPATRTAGQIMGPTTVTGLLRLPEPPGTFTPANEPQKNSWFSIDLPAMAQAAGIGSALPFYVDADKTPVPGGWPQGGQTITDLPNDHLQYAITWYSLAVALIAIYIRFAIRRRSNA